MKKYAILSAILGSLASALDKKNCGRLVDGAPYGCRKQHWLNSRKRASVRELVLGRIQCILYSLDNKRLSAISRRYKREHVIVG